MSIEHVYKIVESDDCRFLVPKEESPLFGSYDLARKEFEKRLEKFKNSNGYKELLRAVPLLPETDLGIARQVLEYKHTDTLYLLRSFYAKRVIWLVPIPIITESNYDENKVMYVTHDNEEWVEQERDD